MKQMNNEPKKSKLEALAQRIYSRSNPPKLRGRRILRDMDKPQVNEELDPTILGEEAEQKLDDKLIPDNAPPLAQFYDEVLEDKNKKFWTAPKIFLIFSLLFFFASASLAYYLIITGFNDVSTKNIKILVKGPTYVESGDLLQLQIYVENRNNARLDLADLIIDYPLGTLVPGEEYSVVTLGKGDNKRKVVRQHVPFKVIEAGELKRGTVRARLFGQKEKVYPINVSLEYRLKGSNAVYAVEKEFKVKVASDALRIDVKGPKEAIFGQDPSVSVTLTNNSKSVIQFVTLEAILPLGVQIKDSSLPPKSPNKWYFPMLEPGEKKEIKLKLKVDGQSGDERVIKFIAGIDNPLPDFTDTALKLQDLDYKIKISRPFLATYINIGKEHDAGYSVILSGQEAEGKISWVNTLAHPIEDVVIAASLSGEALDRYKVKAPKGFYRSVDNILVWDKTTVGKTLEFVKPAASGTLNFSLASKGKEELVKINNPKIEITINSSAKRLSEEGVSESLDAESKKEIRIQSDLDFSARSLYFENPLQSSGPLPPKVDQATVYGIEWTVVNSSNELKDVVVEAYVPPGVTWGRLSMPATENIEFNPTSGKITWKLGRVKPGTGYYLPARRVYFNLVLIPSITQIGREANLLINQRVEARDTFTDTDIKYKISDLTTKVLEAGTGEHYFKVVK